MSPWVLNAAALLAVAAVVTLFAIALLWRVGSWHIAPAATLTHDEGLGIGSEAPQIAAYRGEQEHHLSFGGWTTFVVLGTTLCDPCRELLRAAAVHPATRHMRLVFVTDSDDIDVEPDILGKWEQYRFANETGTRDTWRAPVSPYFHVVAADGRIAEKGVANKPGHLDRLLALRPGGVQGPGSAARLNGRGVRKGAV